MKLIRTTPVNPDDTLGRGMDLALVTVLFTGAGYALDRWLGLFPWLTVGLLLFAVVGQFVAMRYRYEATMQRLEAERRERAAGGAAQREGTSA